MDFQQAREANPPVGIKIAPIIVFSVMNINQFIRGSAAASLFLAGVVLAVPTAGPLLPDDTPNSAASFVSARTASRSSPTWTRPFSPGRSPRNSFMRPRPPQRPARYRPRPGRILDHIRRRTPDDVHSETRRQIPQRPGDERAGRQILPGTAASTGYPVPYAQLFISISGRRPGILGRASPKRFRGFRAPEKFVFEIQMEESLCFGALSPEHELLQSPAPRPAPRPGRNFFWRPVGTGALQVRVLDPQPPADVVGVPSGALLLYHDRRPYLDVVEFSPHFSVDQFIDGDVHIMPFLSERLASSRRWSSKAGFSNMTFLMMSCQNRPWTAPPCAWPSPPPSTRTSWPWHGAAPRAPCAARPISSPPRCPVFSRWTSSFRARSRKRPAACSPFRLFSWSGPLPEPPILHPLPRSEGRGPAGREIVSSSKRSAFRFRPFCLLGCRLPRTSSSRTVPDLRPLAGDGVPRAENRSFRLLFTSGARSFNR